MILIKLIISEISKMPLAGGCLQPIAYFPYYDKKRNIYPFCQEKNAGDGI